MALQENSSQLSDTNAHIVIVGAGIAGISTAIALKRQLGFENFTIYEKASSLGGTWRDTTYPGCGSDIPGHWYSLSTDLNPNWKSYYASQPEIREYWEGLSEKHNLRAHFKFNTLVQSAQWDNDAQNYRVVLVDSVSGEKRETKAAVMFYAIGGFMAPKLPKNVPGAQNFQGTLWHSAKWRHDVDLKGKRVGIVGNGCSAAQFVPEISADPSVQLVNFCRTPQWYVSRVNYLYPRWVKWIFAHVPFVMRWYRNWLMARSDLSFLIFRKSNRRILNMTRKTLTQYIEMKVPKDQLENLIPKYPPGCKRIIVDPGYLDCLHRPNVSLKWDPIDSVVENGIKLVTGEIIPLDVIIFGTGYSLKPVDLSVTGTDGTTLHEYFTAQGGPSAYLGTSIPGFPNLFLLLGPNVASGHASVIFSEEAQIQLALKMIKPVISGEVKSVSIKAEKCAEYQNWLQDRLESSVWNDCNSYYHLNGTRQGRNVATFPSAVTVFWWLTKRNRWKDWKIVGGMKKENRMEKVVLLLGVTLTATIAFLCK